MGDETKTNSTADSAEKVGEEVKEVVQDVAEVPPDPVKEVADDPEDRIPPWGEELTRKVDGLVEQISTYVTAPVEPEPPAPGESPVDEIPVDLPWTHKTPWKRDD